MGIKEEKTPMFDIDIGRLVSTLLKRWWIIALSAILCASLMYFYAKSHSVSTYTSDAMIYVNNTPVSIGDTKFTVTSSQVSASHSLLKVYTVILNSRSTLTQINDEAGTNYSYGALRDMISAGAADETAIFKISVTTNSAESARNLAMAVIKVLPMRIEEICRVDHDAVQVVDSPNLPYEVNSGGFFKSAVMGFLIGCVISAAIILLIEFFNDKLHSEDWLVNAYGESIPLLSVIPDVENVNSRKGYSSHYGYRSRYGYSSDRTPKQMSGNLTKADKPNDKGGDEK